LLRTSGHTVPGEDAKILLDVGVEVRSMHVEMKKGLRPQVERARASLDQGAALPKGSQNRLQDRERVPSCMLHDLDAFVMPDQGDLREIASTGATLPETGRSGHDSGRRLIVHDVALNPRRMRDEVRGREIAKLYELRALRHGRPAF
jgi:hypothetical protein